MKPPTGCRTLFKNFNFLTLAAVFILAVTALALPLRSANSGSPERTLSDHSSNPGINYVSQNSRYGFGWMPSLALAESVAVYAADCTTPKSSFAQGEVVCAITDGVTLGDGTYNLNWVDSQNSTTDGGTITQNPQTFLFALPTNAELGLWKATIGRIGHSTLPDDVSIIGNPPTFTVTEGVAVTTFAANCTTPKTAFLLGDTVCVRVSGLAVNATFPNKISWGDPQGLIRQKTDIDSDPETDTFPLPGDPTSLVFGGITVDNRGTWRVTATRNNGRRITETQFTVSDPADAVADIFVNKFKRNADAVGPGGSVAVVVVVGNGGPDTALNVGLVDSAPGGATLNSFTQQSGPSCTPVGSSTCTISSMARGERAEFTAVYDMGNGTGTFSTSATASSSQTDSDTTNNTATTDIVVAAGGGGGNAECSVGCPDDIITTANTFDQSNNPGAVVHFSEPTGNAECGAIAVDHCNDCFFPVGTTTVTATAATGDFCSFTVTVNAAGSATTISCPPNKSGTADGSCDAVFSLGTATATGTNVTVIGTRNDGKLVYTCDDYGNCTRKSSDASFSVGTSTVTWIAYSHDLPGPYGPTSGHVHPVGVDCEEEVHRTGSASCVQTVFVQDVTPPTIGATNQTVAADASCQAAVPDYSSTVSDNCACSASDNSQDCQNHNDIAYSQSPAAGEMRAPGTYTVHIEANDGTNTATKDITLTVADQTAPVINCPANVVTNTASGSCSATVNPGTATANDNCDTSPTIVGTRSDSQPLNASYPKGTTTITWRATDDAGNYSECQQTVTVNDQEPPTISCPANITVYLAVNTTNTTAVVNYTAPVGQDNCAGATTTQEAGLPSGSAFPVGTTTNTFRVTDASGNYAECSFTVTVLYNFTGFFSPVSNPPAFNNVNAGRAIPIKFSLSGNKGLGIFAAGYPVSQQIACNNSAPLSELEGTETSGGSTLTYSPDTYHYNWKTESSWAGTCRILIVKLNDGTEHTALFKFK